MNESKEDSNIEQVRFSKCLNNDNVRKKKKITTVKGAMKVTKVVQTFVKALLKRVPFDVG